ncbi:hypothetical protein MVG78_14320 [Roseomonas gilardii subsp. gilardii]|uniref:hypothetical protein n=1 Tax=Roseomonas gilardii TaxID=257708 RepID=UPI001FFB4C77|nr:hypothetical protein [Roseomonas gilardii]UPG71713.1 hypothetical protein MVG78_14320 [Roseomonas gilardii subsp. gilardii]
MAGDKRPEQFRFRSHDADCVVRDLDTLGERAQVIPPIAPFAAPDTLACAVGETFDHCRADGVVGRAVEQRLCPVSIGPRLIADDLEAGDTLLERRVVQIGHARLDSVVEPLEA